jgi:hypothetical protein
VVHSVLYNVLFSIYRFKYWATGRLSCWLQYSILTYLQYYLHYQSSQYSRYRAWHSTVSSFTSPMAETTHEVGPMTLYHLWRTCHVNDVWNGAGFNTLITCLNAGSNGSLFGLEFQACAAQRFCQPSKPAITSHCRLGSANGFQSNWSQNIQQFSCMVALKIRYGVKGGQYVLQTTITAN